MALSQARQFEKYKKEVKLHKVYVDQERLNNIIALISDASIVHSGIQKEELVVLDEHLIGRNPKTKTEIKRLHREMDEVEKTYHQAILTYAQENGLNVTQSNIYDFIDQNSFAQKLNWQCLEKRDKLRERVFAIIHADKRYIILNAEKEKLFNELIEEIGLPNDALAALLLSRPFEPHFELNFIIPDILKYLFKLDKKAKLENKHNV